MNLIRTTKALSLTACLLALAGCSDDGTETTFTLRIENVGDAYSNLQSGAFAVPVGADQAGPIGPGGAYEFSFLAAPGHRLSFATMFVPSNDFFLGPDGAGVDLFDASGSPVSGDITAEVELWDAGTEVDQEPGLGPDQVQRQGGVPNVGDADPDNTVRLAADDFGNLPAVADVIQVTLTPTDMGGYYEFTARIENVSDMMTLSTSDDAMQAVPLSPGVYVVHTADDPLFTVGAADRGEGLEVIAEDGTPTDLAGALEATTGVTLVASPGVWAVTEEGTTLFMGGGPDRGQGLEAIAEDGNPMVIADAVAADLPAAGIFNTPVGASAPGPIGPGGAYEATFTAMPGQRLHVITMFVPSNDWLFTFPGPGIELFDGDTPVTGNVASQMVNLDLGTEVDQPVGFGLDQVQNQAGPDTGDADPNANIRVLSDQAPVSDTLSVTLTAQ